MVKAPSGAVASFSVVVEVVRIIRRQGSFLPAFVWLSMCGNIGASFQRHRVVPVKLRWRSA